MNISDRILSRRTALGLSKTALAKAIGVSDVSVGKWESGLNQPKGRYLNDLADVLGVSVDWLLTGAIKPPTSLYAMQVGERIKAKRAQLGLEPSQLADTLGVSHGLISKWERGEVVPSDERLSHLMAALGVDEHWLLHGVGSLPKQERQESLEGLHFEYPSIESVPIPHGNRIPIISYVQAGNWREVCEQATTFDGNVEYVTSSVDIGPCGFGLWLRGNSMTPLFNEGDLVIIDPDEQPRPGDYVVAKNGSEEATFKKYRPRGIDESGQEVFELVPLNDDFPTMHSDRQHIEIIGVMVEHRMFRKR